MMLLMLDFPEPDLPMSNTFFFLGFLTSLRMSAGAAAAARSALVEESMYEVMVPNNKDAWLAGGLEMAGLLQRT
jgi:hypothetical protein